MTDPSAAAVPGVTVTITHGGTGIATVAQTNEQGFYSAPFLAVGTSRVVAEKTGFNVNQIARVDFELNIGSVAVRKRPSRF